MKNARFLLALVGCWSVSLCGAAAEYDLVVYGGTSAGVIAAVQAKKMGKSVVLVCPDKHLGGLSSGGLGFTDTGNKAVIGGLAREFYHRVWKHYDQPVAWKWQKPAECGNKGQGTPAIDGDQRTMWIFEPHVAEQVFEDFVREYQIPVRRNEWLDRSPGGTSANGGRQPTDSPADQRVNRRRAPAHGVSLANGRILSITMLSGQTYAGKMFIDATYEGDLLAAAGVDYTVGREAQSVYDEKWNGVQTGVLHHAHHFGAVQKQISPYVVPGDPRSGVLPRVSAEPPGDFGQGDNRVQAYCYRMCLTNHADNRVPFPQPEGYDPQQYELLVRIFAAGWRETFQKFDPLPNHKTDTNNHGPMSTDNIGFNYDYPEASYERRREILREHATYQQGWLYFIANDPRVPADVQQEMRRWGLAQDEFTDNGHWPHQIYVREARRMIGSYVMTENELLRRRPTPDSVGMGSYTIDSHNVQRYITPDGYVQNEGDIGVGTKGPYEIAYGALVPPRGQCANLLVPICVSSSHIAFGSIRMEPVFMILGQSAATAAVLASDAQQAVQEVPYPQLRARLLQDGQVLEH
ncbi:MAG: FAD-dependent oxidoreductase [Planctomycetota bacterium]|nr:FAD-dependent oxidoreductase [Planctomycetota bacterium]